MCRFVLAVPKDVVWCTHKTGKLFGIETHGRSVSRPAACGLRAELLLPISLARGVWQQIHADGGVFRANLSHYKVRSEMVLGQKYLQLNCLKDGSVNVAVEDNIESLDSLLWERGELSFV